MNNPRATTGLIPLLKFNGVVCCRSDEKVTDVFKKLTVEGFLSVPILSQSGRFSGMVDMLDLVNFTVDLFMRSKYERSSTGWERFFDEEFNFRATPIKDILTAKLNHPSHAPSPQCAVLRGFSTLHPLEVLAKSPSVRRVPVLDEKAQVTGLITQSMMISLLSQNHNRLGSIEDIKIKNVDPALVPTVVSVREKDKAVDAFQLMRERGYSGLAVIDSIGHLTDVISVRDLRGIGMLAEKFHRLWYDVAFFKELVRSEFPKQTPEKPLYITKEATLGEILRLMDDGNIHRVFVCEIDSIDAKPMPTHVISQRDFLLILLKLMGL